MLTPVTSLGIRSGVNCTRLTVESTVLASDLASTVLPVPGMTSGLPSTICEIAAAICPPTCLTASRSSAPGPPFGAAAPPPGPSARSRSTRCVTVDSSRRTSPTADCAGCPQDSLPGDGRSVVRVRRLPCDHRRLEQACHTGMAFPRYRHTEQIGHVTSGPGPLTWQYCRCGGVVVARQRQIYPQH